MKCNPWRQTHLSSKHWDWCFANYLLMAIKLKFDNARIKLQNNVFLSYYFHHDHKNDIVVLIYNEAVVDGYFSNIVDERCQIAGAIQHMNCFKLIVPCWLILMMKLSEMSILESHEEFWISSCSCIDMDMYQWGCVLYFVIEVIKSVNIQMFHISVYIMNNSGRSLSLYRYIPQIFRSCLLISDC